MEKEELKSGIYLGKDNDNVYVLFGGGIHVAIGKVNNIDGHCIALQELNELKECGANHNEEWVGWKPTVHLVINNKNTIRILRDALDIIEDSINKNTK